jgi:hypothetical protein
MKLELTLERVATLWSWLDGWPGATLSRDESQKIVADWLRQDNRIKELESELAEEMAVNQLLRGQNLAMCAREKELNATVEREAHLIAEQADENERLSKALAGCGCQRLVTWKLPTGDRGTIQASCNMRFKTINKQWCAPCLEWEKWKQKEEAKK